MLTGIIRMCLDFVYIEPACGEIDLRPAIVKDVMIYHYLLMKNIYIKFLYQFHYLYFAILLFWITAIVMIVVSLATEKLENFRVI